MAKWRKLNREHIHNYEKEHVEDGRQRARKYYHRHRSDRIAYSKRYAKTHRETIRTYRSGPHYKAWMRQYYQKNWKRVKTHLLKSKYGITFEEFERMHIAQKGLCAICGNPEKVKNKWGTPRMNLAVDHCHRTGRLRGLLCWSCNNALGRFGDDLPLLQAAIRYLKRFQNGK